MKLFNSVFAAAALIPAVSAEQFGRTFDVSEPTTHGFIIELEPGSSLTKRDVHSEFHLQARSLTNYAVRHEFKNPKYFYGLSIEAADVSALASLPEVKNIWPNKVHDRPRPWPPVTSDAESLTVASMGNEKRDNPSLPYLPGDSDINIALKMGGVDEVHKLNITGKGVKVAVIDSGIDYRHPALGGGFGPGFKVAGGYDLCGDDYDGYNDPVPDDDPLAECVEGGHGTHVSSIIIGEDPEGVGFGLTGVAPDAELYMYRIFGCEGSATDDIMMQSLEMAAENGADLISMSVGYTTIWETASPYEKLLNSIQEMGIGIVIAAGNEGEAGLYFASEPAIGPAVIAVGSIDNTKFVTAYHATDPDGEKIEYAKVIPLDDEAPWHVFTTPDEQTSCTPEAWEEITKDWPDKEHIIALISPRSQCDFRAPELINKTGIANIWKEVEDGVNFRLEPSGSDRGIAFAQLRSEVAAKIRAGIKEKGSEYTLSFEDKKVHDVEQPLAGGSSIFSTMGPSVEMSLKPQISAPGGNILSAWPISDGVGYALISGTSMACPYIAGVYALVKQANPELGPKEIARRLQMSAEPVARYDADDLLFSPAQQGAGLVNALKAIGSETVVSPTELNLRDSSAPPTQTITIENKSKSPRKYSLAHRGAAAHNALPQLFSDNLNNIWRWAPHSEAAYSSVVFDSDTIEVPASSKATFEVTITPPSELDPAKLPVYGGFITITSDDEEEGQLVVPYVGVPYQRSSIEVLDTTNLTSPGSSPAPPEGVPEMPFLQTKTGSKRINDIATFTFPAKDQSSPADNPVFRGSIRQPCAYARFDVVPVDTPFKPTSYGFDPSDQVGNGSLSSPPVEGLDEFGGVASYGAFATVVGGRDKPKNPWEWYWRGYGMLIQEWQWATVALDNGTIWQLPNADYRVLIRALRYGFDFEDPEGYDSWLSPVIRVDITDPGYPNPLLPRSS